MENFEVRVNKIWMFTLQVYLHAYNYGTCIFTDTMWFVIMNS